MDGPRRSRYQSGISDFMAADGGRQSSGALPAIDLGLDLESDIPRDFVTDAVGPSTNSSSRGLSVQDSESAKKKEELLVEISNIRKSIDQLRSATPGSSSAEAGTRSRPQSFTSRRTLSVGLAEAMDGPSRPPRAADPRARVQSMDLMSMSPDAYAAGASISRPSSAPLQEDTNWNDDGPARGHSVRRGRERPSHASRLGASREQSCLPPADNVSSPQPSSSTGALKST